MKKYLKVENIVALFTIVLVCVLVRKFPGFTDDINCWVHWSDTIRTNGLRNIYDGDTNYLPVYHYVLWLYGKFAPDREFLIKFSFVLKYFTLIIEILGLWLVYIWTNRKISFAIILIVSLLNPAFIYNNVIWGQVDGILASLALAMLYFVYKRNYIIAAVFLCIMLNFKLQGIIFIPIYFLILLAKTPLKQWMKIILKSLLVIFIVQFLILIPFMLKPNGVSQVFQTLNSLVGFVPKVSSLAYNFWSFILGTDADITPDNLPFIIGLTYKQMGLFLFSIGSAFTLFPFIKYIYLNTIKRKVQLHLPKEMIWTSAALISMLFFYFNTQMHERYSHPTFIFLTILMFSNRKFIIPYLIFSFAYFMNLEFVLKAFKMSNYETNILFNRIMLSTLYGIVILYLAYFHFKYFDTRNVINKAEN